MPILSSVIEPGIVEITISNPRRRNALDLEMFEALAALWPRLAADASVDVVTLRGDGDKAFCAGADLSAHLDRRKGIDTLVDNALLKTRFFPKPLIAAITGVCVAGGLELALAADVRIASDNALIGLPEVRWGLIPSGGGAMKIADQIGYAKAMDLLLTGRLIDGREAERIGLVTEVCSTGETWDRAISRARMISQNSPAAVAGAKRAATARRAGFYRSLETQERALVRAVRATGDPEEGKSAFAKRRLPIFKRKVAMARSRKG
jgi:enoyl-CoA hydratase/carnithine racemase